MKARTVNGIERVFNTGDGGESLVKFTLIAVGEGVDPVFTEGVSEVSFEFALHGNHGCTQEFFNHLFTSEVPAVFAQDLPVQFDGDYFGIDEHAVAVENYESLVRVYWVGG